MARAAGHKPRWFTRPQTVTHPSSNRGRRRVTSLIETNALPLSQAATRSALVPDVVYNGGAEEEVDEWIGGAVERREALYEDGHSVLVRATGRRQQAVRVEQVEHEVRAPAQYEHCA